MAKTKLNANDLAHKNIEEKIDRLLETTDKVAEYVSEHAKTLAGQAEVLKEHIKRTELLEIQVLELSHWRTKWNTISTLVGAAVALLLGAGWIWGK